MNSEILIPGWIRKSLHLPDRLSQRITDGIPRPCTCVKIPLSCVIFLSFLLFKFKNMVTWWAWATSYTLVFRACRFIFIINLPSIIQYYITYYLFILFYFSSILVNPWLTSPGPWSQDLINSYLSYPRLQKVHDWNIHFFHVWQHHLWILSPWHLSTLKNAKSIWSMNPGGDFKASVIGPLRILFSLIRIKIGKGSSKSGIFYGRPSMSLFLSVF